MPADGHGRGAEPLLRRALLGLAGLGVVGTAADLAAARHWQTPVQLVPWATLAVLAGALAAVLLGRTSVARVLAGSAAASGAYGMWSHAAANHAAAPLSAVHGPGWDALTPVERWWAAVSGGVGPAPVLAAGVLGYAALCLAAATLRAPASAPGGEVLHEPLHR